MKRATKGMLQMLVNKGYDWQIVQTVGKRREDNGLVSFWQIRENNKTLKKPEWIKKYNLSNKNGYVSFVSESKLMQLLSELVNDL
jgi:hypothetical protein